MSNPLVENATDTLARIFTGAISALTIHNDCGWNKKFQTPGNANRTKRI